ncbi:MULTISPECIES: BMP family ABC transporter substrate-binding protein [Acinetobacter]|uniref:ABC transporter substrate-binding protein PnrA-like domain-containing protein n=2 Tax=Acinetobacter TaxID=469 RepID=N9DJW2_9GAMM|nr:MULTISPECIES: BMP family ABC transporter substrate-binding protein [Acinetobacter]ENV80768.1 hypothetical protein F942_00590 [Acinetobacter ursingii ANC 3649]MEC6124992.1 BMP family ABC transporter substrate-binding protein [Acinetobacter ursingii]PZT85380.1 MAG: BMP family ABC transporter substrate-binding protein [Acinetobacter sp.]QXZ21979.1 BMP family ABC transporter substrate-binding protein [Acinetobacter septicus]RSC22759.1 BMP family ABC transporter substrate-binding protein [Acinet
MSVEMNKNPNQLHDQSQQGLFSKLFSKFKKTAFCAASSGLLTLGALSTTATVVTTAHAADPLKAAFVYIGPPGDHGWTYAHDQSRIRTEQDLKGAVKTTFVANVPETGDAERVFRNLAQQGNKVIFGTSFGYMNAMEKVSRTYPNTVFMHATGYKSGKNMGNYNIRTYQGAYLLGVLAGSKSKTGKIGFVGSYPIPEVVRNINAFTIGARSVNPKITTQVVWVSSWFDPGKERDAALALISQGCDVLLQNTDSPAVVQAAKQKGVWGLGWNSDMDKFGGDAQLAAAVLHWDPIYEKVLKDVAANKWTNAPIYYGVKEGTVNVENIGKAVSADAKKMVLARRDAIKAGKLNPFAGPLYTQAGKEFVKAGSVYTEAQLDKMNFYVQGVQGVLPK